MYEIISLDVWDYLSRCMRLSLKMFQIISYDVQDYFSCLLASPPPTRRITQMKMSKDRCTLRKSHWMKRTLWECINEGGVNWGVRECINPYLTALNPALKSLKLAHPVSDSSSWVLPACGDDSAQAVGVVSMATLPSIGTSSKLAVQAWWEKEKNCKNCFKHSLLIME